MKQLVVKYDNSDKVVEGCNNMINDGWVVKFMIAYYNYAIIVLFEQRPPVSAVIDELGPM